MEHRLNLLLMGKAGDGKSATGNSLLERQYFKTSSDTTSKAVEVEFNFAQFQNYFLTIVDGLRVESIGKSTAHKMSIDKALSICYRGIDAFLFVLKFGNRYNAEDKLAFDALKQTFGYNFLDHVIVVITFGDNFEREMEEEMGNFSFHDWCKKQTGEFRRLFDDCQERFVLINNREKNEEKKQAKIQTIVQLAHDLQIKYGPYTRLRLEIKDRVRQKILLEEKQHEEAREVQRKLDLLKANIKQIQHGFLKCVLIGKLGTGKSATGNSLLNKHVFNTSVLSLPMTQKVDFDLTQFGNDILMIVDTPGLSYSLSIDAIVKHMETVLEICYGGIDAFLFVIKFDTKLTVHDKSVMVTLKQIFGHSFLDHVILVVTHGDNFDAAIEKEDCYKSFRDWCSERKGDLSDLYDDCEKRSVLFNNNECNEEKKQTQVKEIIQLTRGLRDKYGRYTSQFFKGSKWELGNYILIKKA